MKNNSVSLQTKRLRLMSWLIVVLVGITECGGGGFTATDATSCPSNGNSLDIIARLSAGTTLNLASAEIVNQLNTQLNQEVANAGLGTSRSCSDVNALDKGV